MNHNIYLIGFMGCGKSTVAKKLESLYQMQSVDMDQMISQREGMTIPEIFSVKGESYFRECESTLLHELNHKTGFVVSCGGGVVMRRENVALMKEKGHICLLAARPQTILDRVSRNDDRPLLQGKKNVGDIAALMETRQPAYEAAADFICFTDQKSADEIAADIIETLSKFPSSI